MAKIHAVVVIAQLAIYYKVVMGGHCQGHGVTAGQVLLQLVADRSITHNLVCKPIFFYREVHEKHANWSIKQGVAFCAHGHSVRIKKSIIKRARFFSIQSQ